MIEVLKNIGLIIICGFALVWFIEGVFEGVRQLGKAWRND